jgi:metal-responsive CopG/Arc/MetJ family transcriptional regulator
MAQKRREILCISLDAEVKNYLEELAKKKEVSLSEYVRQIIYNYLIEKETVTQ